VEFYSADGDIELRRDFFVRSVAKHGTQNFLLSGAERLGIARLASLVQEILRARNKLSGK